MQKIAILGSGFISEFYAGAIQGQRSKDKIVMVASRSENKVKAFAEKYNVAHYSLDMKEAIHHPEVTLVCVGLPNFLHKEVILECARAGKGVMCTKPLGRNAEEALEMLQAVE